MSSRRSDAIDGFVITSGQKLTHFAWGKWGDSWKWEVQEFKSADCPSGAISSPSTFNLSDGAMDTVHRIKGSLRDCYWGPDNWQHYEWPAQMATDPAVTVLDGIGYAAYVEVGGNLVIRAIRRQDQAPIPDVSNVVFRDASESYPPSITTRNGALELVFWAGDGSLKRVRVEAGSLTAGAPKTVTPQP